VRMVELSKHFTLGKREYVLSKQVLRSGTSIGALVREAQHAERMRILFTNYPLH
jgi:four helix bundle protein